MALPGAIPFIPSGGQRPLAEAILYRVFKALPRTISDQAFLRARSCVRTRVLLLDLLEPGQPMAVWDWLKSMPVARRRKQLIKAWKEMLDRGEMHSKADRISAFVKSELMPYFAQRPEGPDARQATYVARLIQAPHDETHVVAGPYLKPVLRRLKEVWNWQNWIFYAAVSPDALDDWVNSHRFAVSWFESDYSAFDATYSRQAWEMLEEIYRMIYPDAPEEFWKVLEIWRAPHGVCRVRKEDVRIEYQAEVCNASGRDDTALANALLNGIVLAISFAAALAGKAVWEVEEKDLMMASELCAIAVVGDDSLVACNFDVSEYEATIRENIATFGLIVKSKVSHDLCDMTFLGMMAYPVAGNLYWGPTIGRRLYKAFWQAEPCGHLPAWVKGVCTQLRLYANVPILYDLSRKCLELLPTKTPVTRQLADEHQVWKAKETQAPEWDETTVAWLCRRFRDYGMTPAMFSRDLETIKTITRLPAVAYLEVPLMACCVEDL